MVGSVNTILLPLSNNDLIAYFLKGWNGSAASASPSNTWAGYQRDYISAHSSGTFTVNKPCTLKFYTFGKGSYKQNSGGGGTKITVSITKTSGSSTTTIIAGTISNNGTYDFTTGSNGTTATFNIGDTFTMSASHNHNSSRAGVDAGMMVQIIK